MPEGFDVHHKDGNAFNNNILNYKIIDKKEHQRQHSNKKVKENPQFFIEFQKKGAAVAPLWHQSEEGLEWHKQHAQRVADNLKPKQYFCLQCNNEFWAKPNGINKFCHNNCKSKWRRANNPDKAMVKCEKCNKDFMADKYKPKRFCSKSCKPAPNPYGNKGKPKL